MQSSVELTLQEPQPIDLGTNAVANIRFFRHELFLLCSLSGLDRASEDVRLHYMYRAVGRAARQVIANLVPTMPEHDQKSVEAILTRLEEYFSENTDRILSERLCFNRINHRLGESLDHYAERIRQQAAKCRFECDVNGKMVERFIVGLRHEGQINFILTEGGDNVTFREACRLAKLWWANNVERPLIRPVIVEISVCAESSSPAPNKEILSAASEEFAPIYRPVKEEKVDADYSTHEVTPLTPPPSVNDDHHNASTAMVYVESAPMSMNGEQVVTNCPTSELTPLQPPQSVNDDHRYVKRVEFAPMPANEENLCCNCSTPRVTPLTLPRSVDCDHSHASSASECEDFAPMSMNAEKVCPNCPTPPVTPLDGDGDREEFAPRSRPIQKEMPHLSIA